MMYTRRHWGASQILRGKQVKKQLVLSDQKVCARPPTSARALRDSSSATIVVGSAIDALATSAVPTSASAGDMRDGGITGIALL